MLKIIRVAWDNSEPLVKKRVPWLLACLSVLTFLEMVGIASVFPLLLILVNPEESMQNSSVKILMQFWGDDDVLKMAKYLVSATILVLIFKNISAVLLFRWNAKFIQSAIKISSDDMFSKYIRMPYFKSLNMGLGKITYIITALPGTLYSNVYLNAVAILVEGFTIAILLTLLIYANPEATGFAVLVMLSSGVGVYLATAGRLKKISHITRMASEGKLNSIHDTFKSFKEMRVAGRGGEFLEKFKTQTDIISENAVKQATYLVSTRYIIEIATLIALAIYLFITFINNNVSTSIGHIGLFGAVAMRLMPSINRIISAMQTLQTASANMQLLNSEIQELQDDVLESVGSLVHSTKQHERIPLNMELDKVAFAYNNTEEVAVKDVSLSVPFGTSVGIVGSSGAGKTTVADMILGVIKPTGGTIKSNEKNIFDDVLSWRKNVAYVPQSISFISGSLKNNIVFGLREDEIDTELLDEVIKEAHLLAVISRLPAGLDTEIGEDGKLLSGGERQRVGIARALYQKASVLVLDEATSALDVETEARLTDTIHGLNGKCTTIVIAHRLKTIQKCDKIAHMEGGKLIAFDTFNNLMKNDKSFANLVELSRIQESLEELKPV